MLARMVMTTTMTRDRDDDDDAGDVNEKNDAMMTPAITIKSATITTTRTITTSNAAMTWNTTTITGIRMTGNNS